VYPAGDGSATCFPPQRTHHDVELWQPHRNGRHMWSPRTHVSKAFERVFLARRGQVPNGGNSTQTTKPLARVVVPIFKGLSCACTLRACHPVMICFQDTVETRWREREGKTSRWSSNHSDRIVIQQQQQQQHHHHSHIPADDNPSCTLPKTTSSPYRLIPSPPLLSSAADSFSY
jgi:hypothetical protein